MSNGTQERIPVGGETMGAYLALPKQVPAGVVIVLQEIFGVNAFIRSAADALASDGFIAIAPCVFMVKQGRVHGVLGWDA